MGESELRIWHFEMSFLRPRFVSLSHSRAVLSIILLSFSCYSLSRATLFLVLLSFSYYSLSRSHGRATRRITNFDSALGIALRWPSEKTAHQLLSR